MSSVATFKRFFSAFAFKVNILAILCRYIVRFLRDFKYASEIFSDNNSVILSFHYFFFLRLMICPVMSMSTP